MQPDPVILGIGLMVICAIGALDLAWWIITRLPRLDEEPEDPADRPLTPEQRFRNAQGENDG